jgi:hypothetical protein
MSFTLPKSVILVARPAENGFHLPEDGFELKIRMPSLAARTLGNHAATLFVGRLKSPFVHSDRSSSTATFDAPIDDTTSNFEIITELVEVWFYDFESGQILGKIRFADH